MEVGAKVSVKKKSHGYYGYSGTIVKIYLGWNTNKPMANVSLIRKIGTGTWIESFYVSSLKEITPIKLKKCMQWK